MTRQEFIDLHKHDLAGLVTDCLVGNRQSGELAMFLRLTMQKIDAKLAAIYDQLTTGNTTNGNTTTKVKAPVGPHRPNGA